MPKREIERVRKDSRRVEAKRRIIGEKLETLYFWGRGERNS
jgi:hypothetical protein